MIDPVLSTAAIQLARRIVHTTLGLERWRDEPRDLMLPNGQSVTIVPQQLFDELGGPARKSAPESLRVAGGLAMADPASFFRTARRRIDLVFKIQLGVALLISAVLISSVAGTVISLALGSTTLAGGLGTVAVADLIGAGLYKPLEKIRQALVDAQRLDMIHLSAEQQLSAIDNDDDKLQTYQKVWDNLIEQIRTLEGGPPKGDLPPSSYDR